MRSLRARLLAGLIALAAVGLGTAGAVTYVQLRSFLINRLDEQLDQALPSVLRALGPDAPGFSPGRGPDGVLTPGRGVLAPGAYGAVRDDQGVVLDRVRVRDEEGRVHAGPDVPAAGSTIEYVSARATGGMRYRVLVVPLEGGDLVVALPERAVTQTLRRLLAVEAGVGIAVLAALAGLALWVVRVGLRPLDEIAGTAAAIAEGDLTQRVARAESETEVGRLGLSLNTMLGQIEGAFAEQAASENRLRRFLADASHELRTPLTSIRGYAELFRRGAADRPEDLAKAMRRIEEEAKRMGYLVDDLLLLARLDQGRPLERADVDMVEIAVDAADDARAVDPSRQVTVDAPERLTVIGDGARLRQVAANLVSNALAHTPLGTPVELRVAAADGSAVLEVADRGPGIPNGDASRVFERFYRTDESRARTLGGAGLGLAIVSAIAEAHGGTAEVHDRVGGGLVFRVTVPAEPPRVPPHPEEEPHA